MKRIFVYFSQVIPEDVQVDARLFAVRSAKHVCIKILNFFSVRKSLNIRYLIFFGD
jgi:hypothetical protein